MFYDYTFSSSKNEYEDNSPDSVFYSRLFVSNNLTSFKDEVSNLVETHSVGFFGYNSLRDKNVQVGLNIENFNIRFDNAFRDTLFTGLNKTAFFNAEANILKGLRVLSSGNYVFSGYNFNDYTFSFSASKNVFDSSLVSCSYSLYRRHTGFLLSNYYASHFSWENEFSQYSLEILDIEYRNLLRKIKLHAKLYNITNPIYFDLNARPAQKNTSISMVNFFLSKELRFGSFLILPELLYQISSKQSEIRFPKLVSRLGVYYLKSVKKSRESMLKFGVDINYFTNYYANAYMPATRQFYIQDKLQVGNYPFVDFGCEFTISSITLFVKLMHLNSGMFELGVPSWTPRYPVEPRAIKFGFVWDLFD